MQSCAAAAFRIVSIIIFVFYKIRTIFLKIEYYFVILQFYVVSVFEGDEEY